MTARCETFRGMLKAVLDRTEMQQQQFAQALGISPQYLHDLANGRRLPSVTVVNKICAYMGRGPKGRLEWHRAGAQSHGWEV